MKRFVELIKQVFSFGIVGIICFVVDYSIMIFLTEFFNIDYIVSSAVSFTISTVINYILSMTFVFIKKTSIKKQTEFIIFFVMSVIGLVFNEILMLLFVEFFLVHYSVSKIFTTFIVMIYNFISRKLIFEKTKRG